MAGRKDKQEVTTDDDIYEQMFMAIVTATDDQHSLSDLFKILPSRSVKFLYDLNYLCLTYLVLVDVVLPSVVLPELTLPCFTLPYIALPKVR